MKTQGEAIHTFTSSSIGLCVLEMRAGGGKRTSEHKGRSARPSLPPSASALFLSFFSPQRDSHVVGVALPFTGTVDTTVVVDSEVEVGHLERRRGGEMVVWSESGWRGGAEEGKRGAGLLGLFPFLLFFISFPSEIQKLVRSLSARCI